MKLGLNVLVLTCGDLGFEVADRLLSVAGVRNVTVILSPYRKPKRTLLQKISHVWRYNGPLAFIAILAERLRFGDAKYPPFVYPKPRAAVKLLEVDDFHADGVPDLIRSLAPDLGVVAGTYILKESVFSIPRLGSINLHSGKVPEYRGAAPVFWELYNGECEIGITVHWVTTALDAGHIVLQELIPISPAPAGEVMEYVEKVRTDVLRPKGVELIAKAVEQIASGTASGKPQEHSRARTYRSPDRKAIAELRRRVAERRQKG